MSNVRRITPPPTRGATRALSSPSAGGGSTPFDPASLFGASDEGAVFSLGDSTQVFTSDAGTGAMSFGSTIGYAADLSGKSHPATQATSSARPYFIGWPRTVGANLASNPTFTSDTQWTKGTGWSIASNKATKTAGTASVLSQAISLEAGKTYLVQVNIKRTAGTLTARFTGGTTVSGSSRSYDGSYYDVLVAVSGNTTLEFSADASFAGEVLRVDVNEATSFVNVGAVFNGTSGRLRTGAINASGSKKGTLIVAGRRREFAGNAQMAVFGGTPSQVRTFSADMVTNPRGTFSDGTTTATNLASSENKYRDIVLCVRVDATAATVANQIRLRARGVNLSTTPSASPTSDGALASNGVFTLGSAFANNSWWPGSITRAILINRELTADELAAAEEWVAEGYAVCAVLGDSTSADRDQSNPAPIATRTSGLVGGMVCGPADVANSGDRIADQKTAWQAITGKTGLQAVVIQVGLNDVKGRVGESTATTAQVIADLQDLVDTVNADKPAGCKTYISGMTPCKAWLDTATNPTAAYQAWLDVNAAIAGTHSTNITGVDGRITSHVAALNDGSGNLAAEFNYNSDGVHPGTNGRIIIARAWRTQLEADGLLS